MISSLVSDISIRRKHVSHIKVCFHNILLEPENPNLQIKRWTDKPGLVLDFEQHKTETLHPADWRENPPRKRKKRRKTLHERMKNVEEIRRRGDERER